MNSYAFIGIEKIKTGNSNSAGSMKRRYEHNVRTYTPPNVDPELTKYNKEIISLESGSTYYSTFKNDVDKAIREGHMKGIRKNGVLAAEIVINYTKPENVNFSVDDCYKWAEKSVEWVKNQFGDNNVKHAVVHYDENVSYDKSDPEGKNAMKHPHPHIHVFVVPMNQEHKLSYYSYIHGPKSLTELQTDYYEKVGKEFGLVRGIKNSYVKYTDIRQFRDDTIGKSKRTSADFKPKDEEINEEGLLLPSYAARVEEDVRILCNQHVEEVNELKEEFNILHNQLQEELIKKRKQFEEDKKNAQKRLEKREEEIEKACSSIKSIVNNRDNPFHELKKQLTTYATLRRAIDNYPDREKARKLADEINEIVAWQHKKEKECDKELKKIIDNTR